jgi:hypothetical protein
MSAPRLNWIKKLLYRISFHTDVNRALRTVKEEGYQRGKSEMRPIIYGQYCEKCAFRLVETDPDTYECPLCKWRNTGPMQQLRPMNIYNAAVRTGVGPHTAIQKAISRPTQDLSKYKGETR